MVAHLYFRALSQLRSLCALQLLLLYVRHSHLIKSLEGAGREEIYHFRAVKLIVLVIMIIVCSR